MLTPVVIVAVTILVPASILAGGLLNFGTAVQCAGGQQWPGSRQVHAQHPLMGSTDVWTSKGCGHGGYGNP